VKLARKHEETMVRHFIGAIGAAAWLAAAGAAQAGSASFSIGSGGMLADTGGTVSFGGVVLPDTSAPRVFFTFVLPRDYAPNTPVTLVAYLHSASTACKFSLQPSVVLQRRPGLPVDGTTSVLAPKNGSPLLKAPNDKTVIMQKTFLLGTGGSIGGMKKGDEIVIGLVRNASDPDDTCTSDLYFEAVDVRYTTP
jgi:hypothetical protein